MEWAGKQESECPGGKVSEQATGHAVEDDDGVQYG